MSTILDGLCRIGFATAAAAIEQQWRALTEQLGVSPEPEYQRCFPSHVLRSVSENALRGVKATGCRIATETTQDLVHTVLNQAWQEFWACPAQYSLREKTLVDVLRNASTTEFG